MWHEWLDRWILEDTETFSKPPLGHPLPRELGHLHHWAVWCWAGLVTAQECRWPLWIWSYQGALCMYAGREDSFADILHCNFLFLFIPHPCRGSLHPELCSLWFWKTRSMLGPLLLCFSCPSFISHPLPVFCCRWVGFFFLLLKYNYIIFLHFFPLPHLFLLYRFFYTWYQPKGWEIIKFSAVSMLNLLSTGMLLSWNCVQFELWVLHIPPTLPLCLPPPAHPSHVFSQFPFLSGDCSFCFSDPILAWQNSPHSHHIIPLY